jgi:hypothetical protein
MIWPRYYKDVSFFEIKWKNEELETGYEHFTHTSTFPEAGKFLRNLEDFDLAGLESGATSFDEYPELELYLKLEFDGMLVEHYVKPNPDDPSLLIRDAVYRSTLLAGT